MSTSLERDGYCVVDLPDRAPVLELRDRLRDALRDHSGCPDATLENYHELVGEDQERHLLVHGHLAGLFRDNQWHLEIFRRNLGMFQVIVGQDADIESRPYLRIVRPRTASDVIGMHRDTGYGGSPYEVSVVVPLMDISAEAALKIEAGSHLKGEHEIPMVTTSEDAVPKGSLQHSLGFLYAPKHPDPSYRYEARTIPLELGQALVFSLAALHGATTNRATTTRWSCDTRMINAFAPLVRKASDRFEPLSRSPASINAERYLAATRDSEGRTPR